MPRKMIVESGKGSLTSLVETLADDEAQLQELVKENPDLLPVEEFDMTGPVMVVGRETGLASGAVDLVVLARSGDLLLIEFKTGPQNSDFRAALAQLLDYGSDVWQMSLEEFEQAVAVRYFNSQRCQDSRLQGKESIEAAARSIWGDLADEDLANLHQRLARQLSTGTVHYVLVAQRFTTTMETTMDYLNTITPTVNFWAVELVRFVGNGVSAFESRTLLKPPKASTGRVPSRIDEQKFLESIQNPAYQETLQDLLEACRGLDLRLEWGASGVSIRLPTPDREEPLSIAWLFPPEALGWMGLTDLTLGVDRAALETRPSARSAVDHYLSQARELPGAQEAKAKGLSAIRLTPDATISAKSKIRDLLGQLVQSVGEAAS